MEKTCTKCLIAQEIEQFPIHKAYKGGRTTHCRKCLSKQSCAWAKANKERANAIGRKTRAKHPKTRQNAKFKARYGISLDQFNEMSRQQEHKCSICAKHGSENKNGKLFVDHCHKTGKIRGLLCDRCNKSLGLMEDNVDLLRSSIGYLEVNG